MKIQLKFRYSKFLFNVFILNVSSQFKLDLNPLLPEAFPVLASFLRKNQRALKLSTLVLIETLVKNYSKFC
jgi:hypothetical protein